MPTTNDFIHLAARCRACDARQNPDEAQKLLNISASLIDRLISDADKRREKQQAEANAMTERAAVLMERSVEVLEQVVKLAELQSTAPKKKSKQSKPKAVAENFTAYGEYGNVKLTETQYNRLVEVYGSEVVQAYIDDVDTYCQQQGKTYKDYSAAIRSFIKSDKEKGIAKQPKTEEKKHSYDLSKCVDAFGNPII